MNGLVNIYAIKDFSKIETVEGDQILECLISCSKVNAPHRDDEAPPAPKKRRLIPLSRDEAPSVPKKRRLNTQAPLRQSEKSISAWLKFF